MDAIDATVYQIFLNSQVQTYCGIHPSIHFTIWLHIPFTLVANVFIRCSFVTLMMSMHCISVAYNIMLLALVEANSC